MEIHKTEWYASIKNNFVMEYLMIWEDTSRENTFNYSVIPFWIKNSVCVCVCTWINKDS